MLIMNVSGIQNPVAVSINTNGTMEIGSCSVVGSSLRVGATGFAVGATLVCDRQSSFEYRTD